MEHRMDSPGSAEGGYEAPRLADLGSLDELTQTAIGAGADGLNLGSQ